jgi:hypothetical protein
MEHIVVNKKEQLISKYSAKEVDFQLDEMNFVQFRINKPNCSMYVPRDIFLNRVDVVVQRWSVYRQDETSQNYLLKKIVL